MGTPQLSQFGYRLADAVTIADFGIRRTWSGRSPLGPSFVGSCHRMTMA
ncbi:hypothetical protein H4W80_006118 [Nonomuraea angiospora]|uniref:Uncharacterized protein n=1 Tax=Nonomuraea angiospora TaxID=46172 RepID=A0ABR9M5J0_9ACTN|nr:hypothetical protein [Nonomuraea angiospora]